MVVDSVCRYVNKMPLKRNIDIVFFGRGGQGVITASSITAQTFFLSGFDVKKSDMKGIARRGGNVLSTLVAGKKVYDPKVIPEFADIAMVINNDNNLKFSEFTKVISPTEEETKRFNISLNMFLLGKLSKILDLPLNHWEIAISEKFESAVLTKILMTFYQGRETIESIHSLYERSFQKL